jgi:hypothetical protein
MLTELQLVLDTQVAVERIQASQLVGTPEPQSQELEDPHTSVELEPIPVAVAAVVRAAPEYLEILQAMRHLVASVLVVIFLEQQLFMAAAVVHLGTKVKLIGLVQVVLVAADKVPMEMSSEVTEPQILAVAVAVHGMD